MPKSWVKNQFLYALVGLAASSSSAALAHDAFELLSTKDALFKEYCDTDYFHAKLGSLCYPPTSQTLKIYMPDKYTKIISKQVEVMEKQKNFLKLDVADFFHGHLVIMGHQTTYDSLIALLDDTSAYLYHTDEFTNRFGTLGDGKPEHQVQRSLLGKPDGSLVNAIDLMDKARVQSSYKRLGTIFVGDLIASHPELSQITYNDDSNSPDIHLNYDADGKILSCVVDSQFYIRPQSDGRCHLQDGTPYEIYVLCALNIESVP